MRYAAALLLIAVCACDDDDDKKNDTGDTTAPPSGLTRVVVEPAGANCAHGGYAIATGLDANADGALGDDEVGATSYLCAQANTLTRTVDVASSPSCLGGGSRFEIGPDTNNDGSLNADEVTSSFSTCTGCTNPRYVTNPTLACPIDTQPLASGLVTNGNTMTASASGVVYLLDNAGGNGTSYLTTVDATGAVGVDAVALPKIGFADSIGVFGETLYIAGRQINGDGPFLQSYDPVNGVRDMPGVFARDHFAVGAVAADTLFLSSNALDEGLWAYTPTQTTPVQVVTDTDATEIYVDAAHGRLYWISQYRDIFYTDYPLTETPVVSALIGAVAFGGGNIQGLVVDDDGYVYTSCHRFDLAGVEPCPGGSVMRIEPSGAMSVIVDTTVTVLSIARPAGSNIMYLRINDTIERLLMTR